MRINGREFCVPVKPKPFHNTLCPKGQVPVPGDNGIQCADAKHDAIVVCQDGQIAMETLFGTICVHPHDEQGQIPALGKSCDSDEVRSFYLLSIRQYFTGVHTMGSLSFRY